MLIAPSAGCQARGRAGIPLAPTQPARAWLLGKPGSHFTPPSPPHLLLCFHQGKQPGSSWGHRAAPGGVGDVVQSSDGCWELLVVVALCEASVCVILG